jgi:hypothetical protein
MTPQPAQEIYQANIDAVSQRFLSGDLSDIGDYLAIPSEIHVNDASVILDRLEDLVLLLREQREGLLSMGATEYHRVCTDAAFANAEQTRIEGAHRTYILRGGSYLLTPHSCNQRLENQDGVWRACCLKCQVRNSDYTIVGPKTRALLLERGNQPDPTTFPMDAGER